MRLFLSLSTGRFKVPGLNQLLQPFTSDGARMAASMTSPAAVASRLSAVSRPAVSAVPRFHVQPTTGWLNDPNGPFYDPATRLYHMFYQHYPSGSEWRWGLFWGHAVSEDLLKWHSLEPVLAPTPGSPDADGVWSGCAFPTPNGPVILNTAARLRTNTSKEELPPAHLDLGLQMIESQACAVAAPGDPLLRTWVKAEQPLIAHPPQGALTGWRDPFLVGRPDDGEHAKWTMLIGSGHSPDATTHARGAGCAMVYQSDSPTTGWEYVGELCRGDGHTGSVWECPTLARIPQRPGTPASAAAAIDRLLSPEAAAAAPPAPHTHALILCPNNAHHAPVYLMGQYDAKRTRFEMASASGPHHLDLGGSTLYAPNILTNDPHGRVVLWGWVQETGRPAGEFDSACCLSLPRLLWQHPTIPGRMWQEPLPALEELRDKDGVWGVDESVTLGSGERLDLPQSLTGEGHIEIEVTFEPPARAPRAGSNKVARSGILLNPTLDPSNPVPQGEASGRHGAALLYDWSEGRLDMVFSDGTLSLDTLTTLTTAQLAALNKQATVTANGGASGPGSPSGPASGPAASSGTGQQQSSPQCHHHVYHLHNEDSDAEFSDDEDDEADIERRTLNISGCHAFGGRLHFTPTAGANGRSVVRRQPLTLRIFMDHSLVEAFTSTGEALTARVYRDKAPAAMTQEASSQPAADGAAAAQPASIQVVSVGTETVVSHLRVHRVQSIWQSQEALAALEARLRAEQEQQAVVTKPQQEEEEQQQLVMASVATMSSITTASSAEAMAWEQHDDEKELQTAQEEEVLAALLEGAARLSSPSPSSAVVSGSSGAGVGFPPALPAAGFVCGSTSSSSKRARPTYADRRSSSATPSPVAATASAASSSSPATAGPSSSAPAAPAYLAAPLPSTPALNPTLSSSSSVNLGQPAPPVVPPCTTDVLMCNAGSVLGGSSSGSGTTSGSSATPPASPSMFDLGAGLSSALLQLALTSPRRPCGPAIAPPASPMQGAAGAAAPGGDWA